MRYVVFFGVTVFVASLLFLFLLGRTTYRRLKEMTAKAAEASERIGEAAAKLETITPRERQ